MWVRLKDEKSQKAHESEAKTAALRFIAVAKRKSVRSKVSENSKKITNIQPDQKSKDTEKGRVLRHL